ncbi:hypothetical protein Tco_1528921 [Tanacetum coccineum]
MRRSRRFNLEGVRRLSDSSSSFSSSSVHSHPYPTTDIPSYICEFMDADEAGFMDVDEAAPALGDEVMDAHGAAPASEIFKWVS